MKKLHIVWKHFSILLLLAGKVNVLSSSSQIIQVLTLECLSSWGYSWGQAYFPPNLSREKAMN